MPASVEKVKAGPGVMDRVKGALQDVGHGFGSGADALKTGALNMLSARLTGGLSAGSALAQAIPSAAAVVPQRAPTGPVDVYAQKAFEGLGGAAAGGGVTPMGLASGAAAGVAGEAGSQASGGNPIATLIASLLGGAGPTAVKGLGTLLSGANAPALAKETLKGIDPANLDVARANMVRGQQLLPGVGVNASQAMPGPSNIDDVVAAMANSPQGAKTIEQLRGQPQRLAIASQMAQAQVPGSRVDPQTVTNRAQDAATGAIEDLKKARTASTSPTYRAAPPMEKAAPGAIAAEIEDFLSQPGIEPSVRADATRLHDRILNSPRAPGTESRAPQDVSAYLREFRQGIDDTISPKSPAGQGQMKELMRRVTDALGAESPLTAAANTRYAQITNDIINPAKKGILGEIAGIRGSQDDKAAAGTKLFSLFNRGTPDQGKSTILEFEAAARKQDPTLFPDAVSTHLATKLDSAMAKAGDRGENFAATVKGELASTPAQVRGLKDMLAGAARSAGVPEAPVVNGFMNFIDASTMAARRPSTVSGLPRAGIDEIAGQSKLAGFLTSFTPGRIGGKVSGRYSAGAKKAIDDLLTTPEGLDKLRELAKLDPSGAQAQAIIGTFLGGTAASGIPTQ